MDKASLSLPDIIEALRSYEVFDVSPLLETNMPGWSTHPTLGIIDDARNHQQNGYFAQTLVISEHTGSHVDAPAHVLPHRSSVTIDKFPADVLIAPYKKYRLGTEDLLPGQLVGREDLLAKEEVQGFSLEAGDIALLEFGWDRYYDSATTDPEKRAYWGRNTPGLAEEACAYLFEQGVVAVGSDTITGEAAALNGQIVAQFGHLQYFLPNNILIIEGLLGLNAAPDVGLFFALPLKIKGGSGSPIRAVLIG